MCKNVKELINLLCEGTGEDKAPETILYRGSILNVDIYGDSETLEKLLAKVPGFKYLAGESYINLTYKNDAEMVTVSYTEGDVYITVCNTLEAYEKEVNKTIEFYENL